MRPGTSGSTWINLRHRVTGVLVAVAVGVLFVRPASAPAVDLHATPANFGGVFASANAGDTIHLAAGDYGTFTGAMKPGLVTITPEPGATASMAVDFNPAANIKIDGLQLGDVELAGSGTHDITVANSNVIGQTIFRTGQLANANILFDHNVHANWDKCGNCSEARMWFPDKTAQPSGITVQNSQFGPGGLSDGIQNGSNGTKILNNVFFGLKEGSVNGVHTDAIQLYGSSNTLIRGNYFHDVPDAIMAPDGADHETIVDNVFAAPDSFDYPYAITIWGDDGSLISHNTLLYGSCTFNLNCGIISIGSKSGTPAGKGTIIRDNILTTIACCGDNGATFSTDHNLVRQSLSGTANVVGAPVYVGGAHPTTYAGFALAAGSPGKGTASDGTDRGANVTGQPTPGGVGGVGGGGAGGGAAGPAGSTPPRPVPAPGAADASQGARNLSNSVSSTGLVAAYGFDEPGSSAADVSGNGRSLSLGRARRTTVARSGHALSFRGPRTAVLVGGTRSLRLTHGLTLEAWVRPTARGAWRPALTLGTPRRGGFRLFAGDPSGRPVAAVGTTPKGRTRAPHRLRSRRWTSVALSYDGGVLRLYVAGSLVASRRVGGALPASGPLRIGGDGRHGFRGQIDDVRVYDRALPASELAADVKRPVRSVT